MSKCCPDLLGYELVKPMSVYTNWEKIQKPFFRECLKEKCVAYKDGKCSKYNNEVTERQADNGT